MKKITILAFSITLLIGSTLFGQSTANYDIQVTTIWNATDHTSIPFDPHWSPLAGATHKNPNDILVFNAPAPATNGIKDIAETGNTDNFESEINGNPNADQFLRDPFSPRAAENSIAELNSITVSEEFPYITLVSMVAPSPDWFIAINSENLRSGNNAVNNGWKDTFTVNMYAYDAGTDSGTDYESADSVTSPRDDISMINGLPIQGNRMGTITFTLNSTTLSSDIERGIESIKVFPNPVNETLSLQNLSNSDLKSVEFFTILGNLSKSIPVKNNINNLSIDVSDLSSGIYVLKLQNEAGFSKTQKLIIR